MTRKSTSILAAIALAIGLAGLSVTGCGLDTPTTIQPSPDSMDSDPAATSVISRDLSEADFAPRR